jgi:DNA-binding PadR family transcriptional regulator
MMYGHFMRHFRHGPRGPFGFGAHMHGGFRPGGRGSVKYEILSVLADGPRHGYEIMLAIEAKRGVRPSPGSIYPALQMLEDEDFVTGREVDGKRIYTIAPKGDELLLKHRENNPGAEPDEIPAFVAMMARGIAAIHGARDALKQIARGGKPEHVERAIEIVERARKELYTILAED